MNETITKEEFLNWLRTHHACGPALDWATAQETAEGIVRDCAREDWLIWLVGAMGGPAGADLGASG